VCPDPFSSVRSRGKYRKLDLGPRYQCDILSALKIMFEGASSFAEFCNPCNIQRRGISICLVMKFEQHTERGISTKLWPLYEKLMTALGRSTVHAP